MTDLGAMIRRDIAPEALVAHAQQLAPHLDELWIVEDVPFAGGVSQMATVLATTEKVVLGHGIAPAPFRNPMALAMEWATLERIFPGRVAGGIGHGVQHWMRSIGEGVDSPLTLLEETLVTTQALLAGADPTFDGRYRNVSGYVLEFAPATPPRVSAGVVGPKSLHLSGRVAGGTILPEGHGPDEIRAARAIIDEGRAAAGRTDPHRLTVFVTFYCGDVMELPPPPPDVIVGWGATAETPAAVAAALQTAIDAGVDSLVLVPIGVDPAAELEHCFAEIVPLLRLSVPTLSE